MLRGISPLLSPELLAILCRMGHGDELVLADAHFPGHSVHSQVVRADGVAIVPLLEAILPLMVLDRHDPCPVWMMEVMAGDVGDPQVERGYREVLQRWAPETPDIGKLERFAFYERARASFAVVMTGDTATYANIILKKGVTPAHG